MKKYFLTFADSRMKISAKRIQDQARAFKFFDRILITDESCLDKFFKERFRTKLTLGSRGYGYWVWKPQIIMQALSEMNDEDVLLYTDVGCHLNPQGKWRLLEYFEIAKNSPTGVVAFQANPPSDPLIYDDRNLLDLADYKWTKGDLLDYFNVRNNRELLKSQTIGATVILFRKTQTVLRLVEEWRTVAEHDFSLLDDTPSKSQNLDGFIEHRHDQAIFSILCKLYGVETLSAYEYWYPLKGDGAERDCITLCQSPDWTALSDFPIQARRDKVVVVRGNFLSEGKKLARRVLNFTRKFFVAINEAH